MELYCYSIVILGVSFVPYVFCFGKCIMIYFHCYNSSWNCFTIVKTLLSFIQQNKLSNPHLDTCYLHNFVFSRISKTRNNLFLSVSLLSGRVEGKGRSPKDQTHICKTVTEQYSQPDYSIIY